MAKWYKEVIASRPQLKVRTKDLQQCTEMATGVDSMGQFQFGDMVQIE